MNGGMNVGMNDGMNDGMNGGWKAPHGLPADCRTFEVSFDRVTDQSARPPAPNPVRE